MRKNWMFGFMRFMGMYGVPRLLNGDWAQAIWLLWFVWFLYFIPTQGGSSKE
ncbi:MAG: hypothetical protein GFH27_549301n58 [Chloroflexi bacterium AL-W]|nr:hypothetical protein [Chloroflexi bacterium AL-N1]NOK68251.1 hypothetical protein [Chloroflexi bacterium AL-N10]NOK73897.1 hypothetical protein [Chloroflexi bacterium AL-N5]NOK82865.1 hypothetical protein [Chloroflexi bacterium AL-W]NOK90387.1 hypothetical protein [Chloroflexi bacterium AL-N15]